MKKSWLVVLSGMMLLSPLVHAEQAVNGVTLEQMEQHWQQLISEPDPQKRQALLVEHRKMMEQMQSMHGQGMMGDGHMMHGMDMHRMMMDMISE